MTLQVTRPKKVFNLDALVAQAPVYAVQWEEKEYPIAQMSVATYMWYLELEQSVQEQLAGEANIELYFRIFKLMTPDLPADEIRAQPIVVVTALANYIMECVSEMVTANGMTEAGTTTGTDQGGEMPGE